MKILKITFVSILSILAILGGILIYRYSTSKNIEEEFYVIKENKSYVIEEDRNMVFTIYSKTKNSLITYKEDNIYTLKLDTMSISLENINITETEIPGAYLIKIYTSIPNITETEYFCPNAILSITNPKYSLTLNIGTISLLNPNVYPLLSFDSLYGSYSYVNGSLELVGINISITNTFSYLRTLRIGGYSFGNLSKSKKNMSCDHEINIKDIIPNYSITDYDEIYTLALQSKTYFIPIGYKEFNMIKGGYIVVLLDDVYYYIDTFDYLVNDLDYYEYEQKMVKGDISYD